MKPVADSEGPDLMIPEAAERAVLPGRPDDATFQPSGLDAGDLIVLEAAMSRVRPVTARQLAKVTGMPQAEVAATLETLCDLGLLVRLNTVVPSYTTRR